MQRWKQAAREGARERSTRKKAIAVGQTHSQGGANCGRLMRLRVTKGLRCRVVERAREVIRNCTWSLKSFSAKGGWERQKVASAVEDVGWNSEVIN